VSVCDGIGFVRVTTGRLAPFLGGSIKQRTLKQKQLMHSSSLVRESYFVCSSSFSFRDRDSGELGRGRHHHTSPHGTVPIGNMKFQEIQWHPGRFFEEECDRKIDKAPPRCPIEISVRYATSSHRIVAMCP
jgi:hypothetical protein